MRVYQSTHDTGNREKGNACPLGIGSGALTIQSQLPLDSNGRLSLLVISQSLQIGDFLIGHSEALKVPPEWTEMPVRLRKTVTEGLV